MYAAVRTNKAEREDLGGSMVSRKGREVERGNVKRYGFVRLFLREYKSIKSYCPE
jgi:hypothetical protein